MDYVIRNFSEFVFSLAGAFVLLVGGLALAIRFAIKPIMATWLEIKQTTSAEAERSQQNRRLALLEAEMQSLHQRVQMLVDAEEFRRRLSTENRELVLGATDPASSSRAG